MKKHILPTLLSLIFHIALLAIIIVVNIDNKVISQNSSKFSEITNIKIIPLASLITSSDESGTVKTGTAKTGTVKTSSDKSDVSQIAKGKIKQHKGKALAEKQKIVATKSLLTGKLNISGSRQGGIGYYQEIKAVLERNKIYPKRARFMHIEGNVHVNFTIDQQGNVLSTHLVKTSNHQILDNAALKTIASSNPLPAIPKTLKISTLNITIPFEFSIKN